MKNNINEYDTPHILCKWKIIVKGSLIFIFFFLSNYNKPRFKNVFKNEYLSNIVFALFFIFFSKFHSKLSTCLMHKSKRYTLGIIRLGTITIYNTIRPLYIPHDTVVIYERILCTVQVMKSLISILKSISI